MSAKAFKRPRGGWPCRECHAENTADDLACRKCEMPRPFKRGGLHKLECSDCSCYAYLTIAMLEGLGDLPACLRRGCDGTLEPERVELALILGVDRFDDVLGSVTNDKVLSQTRSLGRQGVAMRQMSGTLNDMSARALTAIRSEQRSDARKRRVRALRPTVEAMPF